MSDTKEFSFLLTEQDVADLFGVSPSAVRKWRSQGKIAFIKVNNTVRFETAEIESFIERNRQSPQCHCRIPA